MNSSKQIMKTKYSFECFIVLKTFANVPNAIHGHHELDQPFQRAVCQRSRVRPVSSSRRAWWARTAGRRCGGRSARTRAGTLVPLSPEYILYTCIIDLPVMNSVNDKARLLFPHASYASVSNSYFLRLMCIKKENVHYYYNQRERHNRVHKIWILKLVCLSDKKKCRVMCLYIIFQ